MSEQYEVGLNFADEQIDRARTEATAEALARAGEVCDSYKNETYEIGVCDTAAEIKKEILALSPDPDYRSRIRGEVLESVVRLCIAHAKVVDTDAERNLANLIASEVHALKETIPNE